MVLVLVGKPCTNDGIPWKPIEIKGRGACFQKEGQYFGGIDLNNRKICRQFPIGVPKPAAVDRQAVLETLPHGGGHINVVQGGLQVLNEKGANNIIVVSMDDGK